MQFFPKTKLGKWSVWLIVAFFALFLVFQILIASGMRGGATFFSNIYLAVTGLSLAVTGISSFFTGIIAVVKSREKAIFTFVSTAIGLFVCLFVLGEILMPH